MAQNLFQTLKQWDIEFSVGPDMLKGILEYMTSFNRDVYFKLFRDKVLIQAKSHDSTQYTHLIIEKTGLQNYEVNIPDGIENLLGGDGRGGKLTKEEKIKYRNIYMTEEGIHKRVFVNMVDKSTTTPLQEIITFLGKNSVKVRIDTLIEKKIEFVTQRGMFIWLRLLDPNSDETKGVEAMPRVVEKIRNDPNIGKAIITMEPGLFKRIVFLGGKPGKNNIHSRGLFEIDVDKGLSIASGDSMRGRVLKLGVLGSNLENSYEMPDSVKEDFGRKENKENKEEFGKENKGNIEEFGNDNFEDPLAGFEKVNVDDNEGMSNDDSGYETGEVPFASQSEAYGIDRNKKREKDSFEDDLDKFNNKKDKKKRKGYDKDKDEQSSIIDDAITNDLTSADVSAKQQLWMEIPYLAPILKLNGLSPIIIEMRTDRPIVVIQRHPYPDMEAMLTIAPRIESEDD